MARGTIPGLILGGVVALGGAAVLSVNTPLPRAPETPDLVTDVDTQGTPLEEIARPTEVAVPPAVTTEVTPPQSPILPQQDSLDAVTAMTEAQDTGPEIGGVDPAGAGQAGEVSAPEAVAAVPQAAVPEAPSPAPDAPEPLAELSVSTEPAQPTPVVEAEPEPEPRPQPQPEAVVPETQAEAPAQQTKAEGAAAEPVESAEAAPAEQAALQPVAVPADPLPPVEASEDAPISAATDSPGPAQSAALDPAPAVEATPAEPEAPVVEAAPEPTPPEAPRIAALPRVEDDAEEVTVPAEPQTAPAPQIGQRVLPLTERESAASSLPTIGETADPLPAVVEEAPAPKADLPPIARYAAAFENPDDKPLMGIVLIDDASSIGAEALSNFPYPLSFAVDMEDPDAAAKMARYRAAGLEVLALTNLSESATAQDVETTLEIGLAALPEVVGLIEGTATGIQGNRAASDQVTAILRDKGYGLITQNSGLNTVQKLALREGVPSAFVFRDFDGAGQSPTVMRRFLDQAAFRAGQEGGVIMLGRVRPETISALLLWGLQDRATRVALAPASAVMQAQVPEE